MKEIKTSKAPAAVGPYSQAVVSGNLVYVSGQIPINTATGELVSDWATASKVIFDNIEAILKEAGTGLDKVIKTTAYLTDISNFSVVNEEYARRFSMPYPARVCVGVSALPKGAIMEIEAVAEL